MNELETLPLGTFEAKLPKREFNIRSITPEGNAIVEDGQGNFWEVLPEIINSGANVIDAYFGASTPDNVVYMTETEESNNTWVAVLVVVALLFGLYLLIK